MTSLDLLIAGVLGLSILLGLMRGLISEVLNLAGWVVSFVLARAFAETAGQMLPLTADTEALRWVGGFVVVLVGSWLGFALLKNVLSSLVRGVGLGALIATHNLDLARRMDRAVELRDGRLALLGA